MYRTPLIPSSFAIAYFILNAFIFSTVVKAARLELDEQGSTFYISCSVSAYAGNDSASDNYQDSSLSHPLLQIGATTAAGNPAFATVESCGGWDTHGSDGDYGGAHSLTWDMVGQAYPYSDEDIEIPAGFSVTMNAEGNFVWEIVPSTEVEDLNIPVFLYIDSRTSLIEALGSNINYEMGIYNYTFGTGTELFGPYQMETHCCPSGQNSTFPEESETLLVAHFGDSIGFSYNTSVSAGTDDPIMTSGAIGAVVLVSHAMHVQPPTISFLDRERFENVKGACSDGEARISVQLILPYAYFFFADDENPSSVQLTVLSPDGKDNGYFIEEGQDNDGDGYDDTPRIEGGIFTQTWCAPSQFDSIEHAANTADSRQIPIQFEIDTDNDGTPDAVFEKNIELVRPPVVMVHGLWGKGSDFSELYMELYNKGFMFLINPSYNNSATFSQNASVVPTWVLNVLDSVHQRYACEKVDIVAHSMGGLLAKRIETNFAQKNIRKIITIGSPYQGSPLADLLINDILVKKPILFGYLEIVINKIISHNEHSLSGGAVHNLRCSGGIPVNTEITGVDCTGIVVGLRDGSFGLTKGVYLTALKCAKQKNNDEELHSSLFGTNASDWLVSEPSQRGNTISGRTIPVSWHCTETWDADFITFVIDKLNEPAQLSQAVGGSMAESHVILELKEQHTSRVTNASVEHLIAQNAPEPNGTVTIVCPNEGQAIVAGESINICVEGTGDTSEAAVFALFGSSSWADIVQLPWENNINIPPDSVGSEAEISVIGLDANMNMTDTDDVNLILNTNVILEQIYFGFGDKWIFDFRMFPDQPRELQLYPLGVFSNGSEHPLSVLSEQTTYSSSNETVATIDPNGLITVHAKGISEVSVANSGITSSFFVEVDTYTGDLDLNGKVDLSDLSLLADQWLQAPGAPSADIIPCPTGDGIVNLKDFVPIADNWLTGVK